MTAVPLIYAFWLMFVFYVIHILDESLLGGSFVQKVQEHWWPHYSWRKFFWFNAAYLCIMGGSIVLYDRGGTAYLFLPIAWSAERFVNSLWHVWWAVRFREYSPGLATSALIWMQTYFIVVGRRSGEPIEAGELWPGLAIGLAFAAFLCFYFPLVKGRRKSMNAGL